MKPGDLVGDCFGGVATGGITAAYRGLAWVGVELELKFVNLGRANINLHRHKLEHLCRPIPQLVQGDSRRFHEIVGEVCATVCSPPFSASLSSGSMSQQALEEMRARGHKPSASGNAADYGSTSGQIGKLPPGQVASVITSPPYADTPIQGGGANAYEAKKFRDEHGYYPKGRLNTKHTGEGYGTHPAQIGALKSGDVSAVVASPPFLDARQDTTRQKPPSGVNGPVIDRQNVGRNDWGETLGQIGRLKSGTLDAVVKDLTTRDIGDKVASCQPIGVNIPEAKTGRNPETKHLNETDTNALTVESEKISMSTTKKIQERLTGNGTTYFQTSLPSANDVIPRATQNPDQLGNIPANSVEEHSNPEAGNAFNAATTPAENNTSERPNNPTESVKGGRGSACFVEPREAGCKPNTALPAKEDYWQAVKLVYESCFRAIKPNGVLVLVCKDYVRAGKRVPLCDDTARLLEHIGFEPLERIHAMLTSQSKHGDLFNGEDVKIKSKKSFFRRVCEKRGSPAIDFEEILIFKRP